MSRRNQTGAGDDLLSRLITARDDAGDGFTTEELVAEAYTAFCHESSAAALTWTLVLLDQHPNVLAAIRQEVREAMTDDGIPAQDTLGAVPLMDRVIMESLRLFPPAALSLRYANSDHAQLDGHPVSKGTKVLFSPFASHRNPDVFTSPSAFDPGRWLDSPRPSTYEYFPFGAGAHNCLGRSYALLEMKTILCILLKRAPMRLAAPTHIDPTIRISLVPRDPVLMALDTAETIAPPNKLSGDIREFVDLDSEQW